MKYKGLVQKTAVGLHEAVIEAFKPFISPESQILDCGAGSGALALKLRDLGYKVEAAEIDAFSFGAENITCYRADLNENFADLINKRFDFITSIEVIEHLENPRHFLRECNRLLKMKGKLLITTPNIESVPGRIRFLLKGNFRFFNDSVSVYDSTHITPIQSYIFRRAVSDCGFEVLSHNVHPTNSFSNCRKTTSMLSRIIAPVLGGITLGDIHIFILEKVREP